MLPIRKVIFPVDYSDCSLAAVPFVRELVQHNNAELTLVHAYGGDSFPVDDGGFRSLDLLSRAEADEAERLQKFACESFAGVTFRTTARLASPVDLIRALARSEPADLVMLPTHGRGLWRRMLVGSVAAKVLHDVKTPVWTATPEALRDLRTPYRSILCACDVEDLEEAATVLHAAASLACKYNASLRLLHTVELTSMAAAEIDYASFREALVESANARLTELKRSTGISAPHQVAEGPISAVIRRIAEEGDVDLIVTGRGHQAGTISRLWSSLYQIVRDAHCPVVSV
jgi:nucleotide-binding universal stress UspA family protein